MLNSGRAKWGAVLGCRNENGLNSQVNPVDNQADQGPSNAQRRAFDRSDP
ncbi:hypothetical protein MKANGN_26820 [Mycobacterium kansasii]|nr:hypothetical protein MKANGN_26820 [Mycobacterium kansasii]VAZ68748.1 hypothetical protein LAUMK40_04902 [Mycobacterium kansasii]